MNKVLAIARVAVLRFIRDRGNLFFVFILPLGIVILIGAQFGGDQGTRVGFYAPAQGAIDDALRTSLTDGAGLVLVPFDSRAAVLTAVEQGNVAAGVVLPPDLDSRLAAGESPDVEIVGAESGQNGALAAVVSGAIADVTAHEAAVRVAMANGADRAAADAAVTAAEQRVAAIDVTSGQTGDELFEGVTGQFQVPATNELVLFMFLTGLAGSAALIQTRNLGITRRMLGTPTSGFTIILGETMGRLAVVLVQGLYIVLATALIFQVDWGNLLGAAAILVVFGACAAGAAMLFGTLFPTDQTAGIIGVIAGLSLGALGGCMLPIELFGPTLTTIAHFTPHAWAVDAFAEIQRHGGSIVDILPQLGIIAAFAAVLIGLAGWRMSVTLGRSTAIRQ